MVIYQLFSLVLQDTLCPVPTPATTTNMATTTPPPLGLSMIQQLKHQCLDHQCNPAPAQDKCLF